MTKRERDFKDALKFMDFIKENQDIINKLSEDNCKRNVDGKVVIEKDDEDEWDEMYKEMK